MALSPEERALDQAPGGASGPEAGAAQASAAIDPVQAHINARKRVNISPNAPSAGYHVSEDDPGGRRDPANFRVLKLDPQRPRDSETALYIPPRIPAEKPAQVQSQEQAGLYIAPHPKPPVPASVQTASGDSSQTPVANAAATLMGNNVLSVRTGNHPGNIVRVVLDVSGPARFEPTRDSARRQLDIVLPGTGWAATPAMDLDNPRVRAYRTEALPDGQGTRLSLSLARPARLVKSMALPPNETFGHRLVFDIAPQ
jgi:hypothetical protein